MKRGGMYARRVAVPARKAGRKAGNALLNFDEAYAKRLPETFSGTGDALGITPVKDLLKDRENYADARGGERMLANVATAGYIGTNLGYRYGLPAAGVTLAGKALMDLTQSYQTSGTIEP